MRPMSTGAWALIPRSADTGTPSESFFHQAHQAEPAASTRSRWASTVSISTFRNRNTTVSVTIGQLQIIKKLINLAVAEPAPQQLVCKMVPRPRQGFREPECVREAGDINDARHPIA